MFRKGLLINVLCSLWKEVGWFYLSQIGDTTVTQCANGDGKVSGCNGANPNERPRYITLLRWSYDKDKI